MPIKKNERVTSFVHVIDAAAMNEYMLLKKSVKDKLSKKQKNVFKNKPEYF